MRYWVGNVKMGHMGRGNHSERKFYVKADNIIEATAKLQRKAGVKHKGIPLEVRETKYIPKDYRDDYGEPRKKKYEKVSYEKT
jgi:hypothetical protein